MRPKNTLALALSLAAALGAGCGMVVVTQAEQEMPGAEHASRRMPGSTVRIFTEAKTVLRRMGFTIVSERENSLINGKIEMPRKPEPVHINLMIFGGDRVHLRFYNLNETEKEKLAEKIFRNIRNSIKGIPAERERRLPVRRKTVGRRKQR